MTRASSKKLALFSLLLAGFLNYVGIALVYPLFAFMLFDQSQPFLPPDTSPMMRGFWLGFLIALQPLTQFLSCPILGAMSDRIGRKKIFLTTLWIALGGYMLALVGVWQGSLLALSLYRILVGIAGGSASIVSAIIADLSLPEEKPKHYGYLNMAYGFGFTIGPFLGGVLFEAFHTLIFPFLVPFVLVAINIVFVIYQLEETYKGGSEARSLALPSLKKALQYKQLRVLFLSLLLFTLGWTFFSEFIPLFLIDRFDFAPKKIGYFYGFNGIFYALCTGFIIQPVVRYFDEKKILFISLLCSGVFMYMNMIFYEEKWIWILAPFNQFALAFSYPLIATLISNRVSADIQGEVMGIYQSIIAIAFGLCPLCVGGFIGAFPSFALSVGGSIMVLSAVIFGYYELPARRKLIPPPP